MELSLIDYPLLKYWSHTDLAYITHDLALRKFYEYDPVLASFQQIMDARQEFQTDRILLAKVLKKQYKELGIELPVEEQMLLRENTFTVVTAHQPTLFTGPLYHIYKIASTIHLAREISDALKGYKVIPFFVVNSEDHDWAEVNHLHLFGKKLEWERSSTGPSGRLP
ncbi:MAG: bacillithiol biosynthesis BshC, partial [Saprospiraceae bacterium]